MDNDHFAYTHINILKITMVSVSVIKGVPVSIIDEKRLGKPPLPSRGPSAKHGRIVCADQKTRLTIKLN